MGHATVSIQKGKKSSKMAGFKIPEDWTSVPGISRANVREEAVF